MGKLLNTCKNEKENKKHLSVQSRGETFNSVKKTELDWGCTFHFRSGVRFRVLLKIASSPTDHSMSYFSDFYSVMMVQSSNLA